MRERRTVGPVARRRGVTAAVPAKAAAAAAAAAPAAGAAERIVDAAMRLFQQRGYHAVGTAEILAAAGAPRGSMYHHFPLGKEQIAAAAVLRIRRDVLARLEQLQAAGHALDETIRRLARGIAPWFRAGGWRDGALLGSLTVGAVPDLAALHAAIRQTFDDWRAHLVARLRAEGWRAAGAQAMSHTILASIEGAMVIARVDRDERTLTAVADLIARLVAAGDR